MTDDMMNSLHSSIKIRVENVCVWRKRKEREREREKYMSNSKLYHVSYINFYVCVIMTHADYGYKD